MNMWQQIAYGQIWHVAHGHYGLVQTAFSPRTILTYYPNRGAPQQLCSGPISKHAAKVLAQAHHQQQTYPTEGRALMVNGVTITGTIKAVSTHTRLDGTTDLEIRFTPDDPETIVRIIETLGVSK